MSGQIFNKQKKNNLRLARFEDVKVMYIFDYMLPTMKLKAFATLTTLILCGLLSAQTPAPEQDCVGAIPICITNYSQPNSFSGIGLGENEINSDFSCLGMGEVNSAWYKIYITSSGNLGFNISPYNSNHDYDWAVFNLTGLNCSNIYSNSALEVSCNFSGSIFPNAITGPNNGPNPQDETVIPVNAGEVYYINIGSFGAIQAGYSIDFSISTCGLDSCLTQTITDLSEKQTKVEVNIYPNPTSQNITLKLNALKTGQSYSMQLFTATGALVHEVGNIKTVENTVDVSTLASGLYYYRVLTTDGKTAAGRFVKE